MVEDRTFHILSIDGGGARGIYPAQILASIEQMNGSSIREHFDLIAGTSTGSIIAGAAAAGLPMATVADLFRQQAPRIFRKSRLGAFFFRSKYPTRHLQKVVQSCVADLTLGEIITPLMIMGSDISTGGVHVFKSRYLEDLGEPYVREANVLLSDAILASCAAPIYFDPVPIGDILLADGGLWANNPSIMALTETISRFKRSVEQVRILSIGTGHSVNLYSRSRFWGFLTGWRREQLVSYVFRLQSAASENMAGLLLKEGYLRLDPEIEPWGLDDIEHMDSLAALAARDFARHSGAIMSNLRRMQ